MACARSKLCIIGLIICYQGKTLQQQVDISPSPVATVVEGQNLTLVCSKSVTGNYLRTLILEIVDISVIAVCTIVMPNCFCNTATAAALYHVKCNPTNVSITVIGVNRNRTNNVWSCTMFIDGDFQTSGTTQIAVRVPISSVVMTSPTSNVMTVNVSTTVWFECTVTESLPNATILWYHGTGVAGIQSTQTIVTNNTDRTMKTVGRRSLHVSKADNGVVVYCTAFNGLGETRSTPETTLIVQYRPDGPPSINSGSDFYAIHLSQYSLTCTITGGNPLANLVWNNCYGGTVGSQVIVSQTVSRTFQFVAGSSNEACVCTSSHPVEGSKTASVGVKILYPPTTPLYNVGTETSFPGPIKVVKGSNTYVRCISNSTPAVDTYKWTLPNGSFSSSHTLSGSDLSEPGKYRCDVTNSMVPSQGSTRIGSNYSSVQIELLYPPTAPQFHYGSVNGQKLNNTQMTVVKNDQISLACKSDSNPPPSYSWLDQLWTGTINKGITLSCIVSNTMLPTGMQPATGSVSGNVTVIVQIPPSQPTLSYQNCAGSPNSLDTVLKVKVGTPARVTCSATGDPSPSYSWSSYQSTETSVMIIPSVVKGDTQTYNCTARNYMNTTFTGQREGSNSKTFTLETLYSPVVQQITNKTYVEDDTVNIECSASPGNPASIAYTWNRANSRISDGPRLQIMNVPRSAADFYTCTASNDLQPTGCPQEKGTDFSRFYIDVQYKSTVSSFIVSGATTVDNVTVDENSTSTFICSVKSNPGSTISLLKDGSVKHYTNNVHQLQFSTNAYCTEAGVYTCSSVNQHNIDGVSSTKRIQFFVKCSPRAAPNTHITYNVTSPLHASATLSFTALAYPSLEKFSLMWQKCRHSTCEPVELGNKVASFSLSGFGNSFATCNLTVLNVTENDYGKYRLALNGASDYGWTFHLNDLDKPSSPMYLSISEETVTESSANVSWTAGFNGGLPQTFQLRVRKESDSWNVYNVTDETSTKDRVMSFMLENLQSDSKYEVEVFAFNDKGTSSAVQGKFQTLKQNESASPETNNTGAIVGGIMGGIAGILLAVFAVCLLRKYEIKCVRKHDSSEHVVYETTTQAVINNGNYDELQNTDLNRYFLSSTTRPNQNELNITRHENEPSKDVYDHLQSGGSNHQYADLCKPSFNDDKPMYGTSNIKTGESEYENTSFGTGFTY